MELSDEAMWVQPVGAEHRRLAMWDCNKAEQVGEGRHLRLERRRCSFWNALSAMNRHSGVRLGCDEKGCSRAHGLEEELQSIEEQRWEYLR